MVKWVATSGASYQPPTLCVAVPKPICDESIGPPITLLGEFERDRTTVNNEIAEN